MSDIIKFCAKHGETEFYYNKKHNKYLCKKCNKDSVDKRRWEKKEELVKYKGGKCEVCGYDKCIDALEFHHINKDTKSFGIGGRLTRSLNELKKEADKCILVCSNCHREIHYKENKAKRDAYYFSQNKFYEEHKERGKIDEIDKDFVIDCIHKGMKKKDIANIVGVSVSTLTRFFEKVGINMTRSIESIEDATEPTEGDLKTLRANGKSFKEIGEMFHHGRNYISALCKKYGIK